jgi:hypothetical protein
MMDRTQRGLAKAHARDSLQALEHLTEIVDGRPRIVADPPLLVPIEDLLPELERRALLEWLRVLFARYRRSLAPDRRALLEQFEFVQLARKVVGVGSVGLRAWVLLFVGRDQRDPLILQAKEAQASVLERHLAKSRHPNHGQRVVAGQHLMQAASDIFLGWQRAEDAHGATQHYYVRQLRDWKGSVDVDHIAPTGLTVYAGLCARALARAHARSGDRIAIAAYLGSGRTFEQALAEFAERYADQNERDYEALRAAAASGRITAQPGH